LTKFRDPVSAWIHLISALLSIIGTVVLLRLGWGDWLKELSLLIYGLTLILLFTASTIYHSAQTTPERLLRLRKLDHSSIYLLIAGSYTPLCLYFFTGFWRWGFLGVIWLFGLVGILVKVFVINAPRWVTAGIYLVMGWLSIFAVKEMLTTMPPAALIWLLAGGLFYTLGAVIYITKKLDFLPGVFGFHEVWHVFVTLGALCHFIMIAAFIAR
jgi:channel protein, hemolysin III family